MTRDSLNLGVGRCASAPYWAGVFVWRQRDKSSRNIGVHLRFRGLLACGNAVEAQIFPGMAHAMMLEPRWREVADRILAWLAGLGL